MKQQARETLLKLALRLFGVIFMLVYPLGLVWPAGWVWHGGMGGYYLQMIAGIYAVLGVFLIIAANNPPAHRSLIAFTAWSSLVHAAIMAVQAMGDSHEHGHLMGDVPALVLVAVVLWILAPPRA
jgi:DNA-binding helix-hairpin-helix protein with protein kinase domain